VTVALFELPACRRKIAELTAVLSAQERSAAEAMTSAARREAFVAGRALLRLLLADHHPSRPPRDWRIGHAGTGRPVVLDAGGPDVSVAHAGDLLAIAMSAEHRVGIDIKRIDEPDPGIARFSVLTTDERRRLLAAPVSQWPGLFLRMRTLKEAALRCTCAAGQAAGRERLETSLDPVCVTGPPVVEGLLGAPLVHQEVWGPPDQSYCLTVVAGDPARPLR
jgi:4'-phosphopantetheinyl transferase